LTLRTFSALFLRGTTAACSTADGAQAAGQFLPDTRKSLYFDAENQVREAFLLLAKTRIRFDNVAEQVRTFDAEIETDEPRGRWHLRVVFLED
jgi:hypothetical protein